VEGIDWNEASPHFLLMGTGVLAFAAEHCNIRESLPTRQVQRLHAKMGAELLAHPERYRVFVSPRVLVTVLKPMLDFGYHKEAVVAIQSNTSSLVWH
jgi:hypothetical protein